MTRVIFVLLCASITFAANPKLGPKIKLFNGKDLAGFYTYLQQHGKNNDPDHVFRVQNGVVHVSGVEFGYFITEKEYETTISTLCFVGVSRRMNRARTRRAIVAFCSM